MAFKPSITSLEMSDGTTVSVPRSGVVVFVGPNNSGKSVSLRDIMGHLTRQQTPPLAAKSIEVDKGGSTEDLSAWLDEHAHKSFSPRGDQYSRGGQSPQRENLLLSRWNSGPPFEGLGDMLLFFAGGAGRLDAANGVQSIDFLTERPTHPLHFLYLDPELEKKVSGVSERAFRIPLFLNRHAGTRLYLQVGEAPLAAAHGVGPPSHEYLEALRSIPRLDEQGDGMKSFMGLLLNILVADYPFVLVDEPEAFLHPPQAQLLGRMLGDEKGDDAQVFIATHDSDVLTGLLNSSTKEILIVRLVRDGDVNRASQLNSERVKDLWKDPILRYSNILDGLFHEAVVLCESDADCRFYNSILEAVEADEEEAKRPQLLFTHCGGKHRMPAVIEALRAVSVPVRVIADFDVLREKKLLEQIVAKLGGDWASLSADWSVVASSLDADTRGPSTAYVREEMGKLLNSIASSHLEKEDVKNIRQLTKADSGWDKAKRNGKLAVPRGEAAARIETLLPALRDTGLLVVEVGELEGFAPTVGSHGPAWVNAVHEHGLHADGSLTEAEAFVRAVIASL